MKNIKKITFPMIYFIISHASTMHAFFNDDFEEEFIERINHVEKAMKETEENIQAQLKEFHNKFFNDLNNRTKDYQDYANQNTMMGNQNYIQHYQQASTSLSFTNNDKAIKIMEQKDNKTKTYTIIITDKDANTTIQKDHNEPSNIITELKELELYMKKTFHSQPAEKIIDECINAMKEDNKDNLVNIVSSTNGNQKKYTIEIAHTKEPVMVNAEPAKKNRKNKNNK